MLFLISDAQDRPSMLTDNKDEDYHVRFARYCAGQANNFYHTDYINRITLNKDFYKGNQWLLTEDLEAFFKDDTMQDRNRIKIINNLIRPMVEQYRGNAIRMQINARVKSVSPRAITRREEKLQRMLFMSNVANQEGNPFGEDLKKRLPIGNNESETAQIFDNLYVDGYVETMNNLLRFVSELNRFEAKQLRVAEELALSGIAIIKTFEWGGNQVFDFVESQNFFWDRSAKSYDLTDAEFMGELIYMAPSEIYERNPNLTPDERQAIDNYSRMFKKSSIDYGQATTAQGVTRYPNQYDTGGKVPVINVYWRDTDKYEYGYVMDEFGYPYLTKINYTYEGDEKPRYTDKDLIEVKTMRAKKVLRGDKSRELYVDTLRYTSLIPREVLMTSGTLKDNEKLADIVFDWGIAPYQETESLDLNNVQFPYKCYCWGYIDGEVLSPIDDAINPQRFINRVLSVAENQINNSRGSGIMYDKSAVDNQDGEDAMLRNMNLSKPVAFNAKGRGIQNIATTYDTSIKQGTMIMFNIVDIMKNQMQNTTGVNEGLKGESTGSDQLVGVTQLMIQRGSLMQEPFYNAISEIFLQCYQSIATVGKRIYADNERELAIVAGDDGAKLIKITRDMKTEVFRTFVKRENPDDILINAGNQMLLQYLQLGLIDQEKFSLLTGRSTPDEISAALRKNAKEMKEVARMTNEANKSEEAAMGEQANMEKAQMENMAHEQVARDDIKDLTNKQHDMKMVLAKSLGALAKTDPAARNQVLEQTKDLQKPIV